MLARTTEVRSLHLTARAGALLLLSLTGCAKTGQPSPAWPEAPSPSYPAPPGATELGTGTEGAPEAIDKQPPAATSNALAREYEGKKALSTEDGKATYYADSLSGNRTASGEVYDPKLFTAAHKKLPFGTVVRVVRTDTGAATYVKINDRGPFGAADRVLDLSRAAAEEIEMIQAGVIGVRLEIVSEPPAK